MRILAGLLLIAVPGFGLAQFASSVQVAAPAQSEAEEQTTLVSFSPWTFDAPTTTKIGLQASVKEAELASRPHSATDGTVLLTDWRFTALRGRSWGNPGNDFGNLFDELLIFQQELLLIEQQFAALVLQLEQEILILEKEIISNQHHCHSYHR